MQKSGVSKRTALAALICGLAAASAASKLEDHFKVCSRSDPQLGQCIADSLNGAREELIKGIPDLGLQPLDPLLVEAFDIEEKDAGINLKVTMTDNVWLGLGNFTAVGARVDLDKPYLELHTVFPHVQAHGPYTFAGRVLALLISGKGDYEAAVDRVNVTHRIDLREEQRGGEVYWEIAHYRFDMDMGDLTVSFNNLFDDATGVESFTNDFLNKNWRTLYQVYRPAVADALGIPFKNFAKALFQSVPLSAMFSD